MSSIAGAPEPEPAVVELSMDDLRSVAAFSLASAESVLALYDERVPEDARLTTALDLTRDFANGSARSRAQRTAAVEAHRAAKAAPDDIARHAAHSAGDAAASAYLHPLAQATQVAHILLATAQAARALELAAGDDHAVGDRVISETAERADQQIVDVLRRYPQAPTGRARVAELMSALDDALRARGDHGPAA